MTLTSQKLDKNAASKNERPTYSVELDEETRRRLGVLATRKRMPMKYCVQVLIDEAFENLNPKEVIA